jgi:hypothetical protein
MGLPHTPQCSIGALFRMQASEESPELWAPDDWQLALQVNTIYVFRFSKIGMFTSPNIKSILKKLKKPLDLE